jgi:hypothetical protein
LAIGLLGVLPAAGLHHAVAAGLMVGRIATDGPDSKDQIGGFVPLLGVCGLDRLAIGVRLQPPVERDGLDGSEETVAVRPAPHEKRRFEQDGVSVLRIDPQRGPDLLVQAVVLAEGVVGQSQRDMKVGIARADGDRVAQSLDGGGVVAALHRRPADLAQRPGEIGLGALPQREVAARAHRGSKPLGRSRIVPGLKGPEPLVIVRVAAEAEPLANERHIVSSVL